MTASIPHGTMPAWPPNYGDIFKQRINRIDEIRLHGFSENAYAYYSKNIIDFIEHWTVTYDPRNSIDGNPNPTLMPFILFPRQRELVKFIISCVESQKNGLVEKSRDMGATWLCCAISVWLWLFKSGVSIGWGSRKQLLVDRLGDPDSIFEKIRIIIGHLPNFLRPPYFSEDKHLSFMRCLNPANDSTITGEAGDNIGRGGRKLIYFKDESAHYLHADKIDAALSDNTNVQLDISSVNGTGNIFHAKRNGGRVKVFVLDWRDHPLKDDNWYDERKKDAEAKGLLHLFAQEVDRDYSAAVEDVFIPAHYVKAAIDAHKKIPFEASGTIRLGFDPHDTGSDKHAVVVMHGNVVLFARHWSEGECDDATFKTFEYAKDYNVETFVYDSIGIGAAVKSTAKNILNYAKESKDEEISSWGRSIEVIGWNAGLKKFPSSHQLYKGGKKNFDLFCNAKAHAWWGLRDRFIATYRAINGQKIDDESQFISLPSEMPYLDDLITEISQPKQAYDAVGRVKVESKDELKKRGIRSHNLADALVLATCPIKRGGRAKACIVYS